MSSDLHFFSFLMDGTTDAGNLEDELVLVQFSWKDSTAKEIKSCARYLSVVNPTKADTDGLVDSLKHSLARIGLDDVFDKISVLTAKPILISGGTDGTSVNVGQHKSIKERLQKSLPWMFWSWCYAHRLELASKSGLISPLFKSVEEMLLRLYYLYHKSPKKTHELVSLVEDLKNVFNLPKAGNVPIRSEGSRWITHKRRALQRVIDRYGAYINHLTTLSQDSTIKTEDRARLKGYLNRWANCKILIGCVLYVEVLKPVSILSLALQGSNVDIVSAIKSILKTTSSLKSLTSQDPHHWSVMKQVLERIEDDGVDKTYHGVVLLN